MFLELFDHVKNPGVFHGTTENAGFFKFIRDKSVGAQTGRVGKMIQSLVAHNLPETLDAVLEEARKAQEHLQKAKDRRDRTGRAGRWSKRCWWRIETIQ